MYRCIIPKAIPIAIGIPAALIHRIAIDRSIAVIVQPIADLSCCWVDHGIVVITLFTSGKTIGIGISIAYTAITIVVIGITACLQGRAWVIGGICIIAVIATGYIARRLSTGHCGNTVIAIAIAIRILIPEACIPRLFIGGPIAVIVQAIAQLWGIGVDSWVAIITVAPNRHIALWWLTGIERGCIIPIAVFIVVQIPGAADSFIHNTIAVIIHLITKLSCARVDTGICVIAVIGAIAIAIRIQLGRLFRQVCVLVTSATSGTGCQKEVKGSR
jgi:hypothetical protein